MRPTLLPLLVLLLLAACAGTQTPTPALAFAEAAAEGARLAEAQARARGEAAAALRRAVVASRGDQVLLRGADCRLGGAPQACVPRLGQAQAPLDRLPADAPAARAAPLLAYAQALGALAAAGDGPARAAAQTRMQAALADLGAPAAAPGGLQAAITAADAPVQRALADLASVVAGQREATADDRAALLLRLVAQYNAMLAPAGDAAAGAAAREALLARIASLAAAQRRLLAGDPVPDLRALGPAHQRLRRLADAPGAEGSAASGALAAELADLAERLRRAAAAGG